jgi:uncharacterized protein YeaO (DUF488 family)
MKGTVKQVVHHYVSIWEEEFRPKTWVDSLSQEDQKEWDSLRQSYKASMRRSQKDLDAAKKRYEDELERIRLDQLVELEVLRGFLRGRGVVDAPILQERTEVDDANDILREFAALGITVQSPIGDGGGSRA